jgi:hypothetical protein
VAGKAAAVESGARDSVALFDPGEIVAYLIRLPPWQRLFVFRTLAAADPLASDVPGVRPAVALLVSVRTNTRIRVVRDLLEEIERQDVLPSRLSDGFYLRLSCLLGGRGGSDRQRARALLERELPSEGARSRAMRRGRS